MNRQDLSNHMDVIQELFNEGMSIESIAFQLDANPSDIYELAHPTNNINADINAKKRLSRMDKIRRAYYYLSRRYPLNIEPDETYYKDEKVVEVIESVREKTKNYKRASNKDKSDRIISSYNEIKRLKNLNIRYEYALELKRLLNMLDPERIKKGTGNVDHKLLINEMQKMLTLKAYADILRKYSLARTKDDIDILESIKSPIEGDSFFERKIQSIEHQLISKRSNILREDRARKIATEIDADAIKAINGLLQGDMSVDEIKGLLLKVAKKRNKSYSSISASNSSQESQLLHEINRAKRIIEERFDLFPIKAESIPEIEERFVELKGNGSLEERSTIIKMISNNLIGQRKYDEVVDYVTSRRQRRPIDDTDEVEIKRVVSFNGDLRRIRRSVAGAKIGESLLERIKANDSREKDKVFLEVMDRELEREIDGKTIGSELISLGYDQFRLKKITYADITHACKILEKQKT